MLSFQSLLQLLLSEHDPENISIRQIQIEQPLINNLSQQVAASFPSSSSNPKIHPTCCYLDNSPLRRSPSSLLPSPPTSRGMAISCLLALGIMLPSRMALTGQPTKLLHIRKIVLIVSSSISFLAFVLIIEEDVCLFPLNVVILT